MSRRPLGERARGAAGWLAGLPFRGLGALLRSLFGPLFARRPWLKWLLVLLPALLLLSLLSPVTTLLTRLLDGLGAVLKPVLESPAGRFLSLNLLLVLLLWLAWRLLRRRVERLLGAYVLARYLEGITLLLRRDLAAAAGQLRSALRWARWFDPARAVPEAPFLREDAALRLATVALARHRVNEALRWLLRIRPEVLSREVRSTHRELLAQAYTLHPTLGREAADRRLEEIHREDPDNPRILTLLRDRRAAREEWEGAAQAQARLLAALGGNAGEEEGRRLGLLWFRAARDSLGQGQLDQARQQARRALQAWPEMEAARILLGDLALAQKGPEKALRQWAEAPGLLALDRLERLAAEGAIADSGALTPRLVARSFPHGGVLVVLARHWVQQGELRKARNALRRLMALGDRSPRVLTLYAAVLERMGEKEEAAWICREALGRMLGLPGGAGAGGGRGPSTGGAGPG